MPSKTQAAELHLNFRKDMVLREDKICIVNSQKINVRLIRTVIWESRLRKSFQSPFRTVP